jgi:hypothetical protein
MLAPPPRLVPLRAGSRAVLSVAGLVPLPVTVAAVDAEVATLVLDAPGSGPARMLHRRAAALEVVADARRFRADGTLAMVAGARGGVREGVITFRPGGAGPPSRRRDPRVPAIVPVTLVPVAAGLASAHGLTIDVSAGGLLVRGGPALRAGQVLGLRLTLPAGEAPVRAAGEVVRTTPDGLRGVRLDRVRPADRERLLRWARRPDRG